MAQGFGSVARPFAEGAGQAIRAVHWPSAGYYMLVTIQAANTADSLDPPSYPPIVVNYGTSDPAAPQARQVDVVQTFSQVIEPPRTEVTTLHFVWPAGDIAPAPTADNWSQTVMSLISPPVYYSNQFARHVSVTSGSGTAFEKPFFPGPVDDGGSVGGANGFFPTAEEATAYAALWNSFYSGEGGDWNYYALAGSGFLGHRSAVVEARSLDLPITGSPFSRSQTTKSILYKIPVEEIHTGFNIVCNSTTKIDINGYSDRGTIATVAAALLIPADVIYTGDNVSAHNNGAVTYVIKSSVGAAESWDTGKTHHAFIDVAGGEGDGGIG